jgi:hypothetical protein
MDAFNDDTDEVFTKPPPRVAAREEPQPGLRLATLLKKENMDGKLSKLKAMHDSLDAQSKLVGTVGVGAQAVPRNSKTLPQLIRIAATIEKAPPSGAQPTGLATGACADVKAADMAHFCDRHTREHTKFVDLAGKNIVTAELNSVDLDTRKRGKRKAKTTSLWPEGVTDVEIARWVSLALTTLGAQVPRNANFLPGGPLPVGGNKKGNFIQFNGVAIPSAPPYVVTIGFEWLGPNDIKITQFYPEGGPGLASVVFYDLHAIQAGVA